MVSNIVINKNNAVLPVLHTPDPLNNKQGKSRATCGIPHPAPPAHQRRAAAAASPQLLYVPTNRSTSHRAVYRIDRTAIECLRRSPQRRSATSTTTNRTFPVASSVVGPRFLEGESMMQNTDSFRLATNCQINCNGDRNCLT